MRAAALIATLAMVSVAFDSAADDARPCIDTPTPACLAAEALDLFLTHGEPDSTLIQSDPGGGGIVAQSITASRLPMILLETRQRAGYEAFARQAYRQGLDVEQYLPVNAAVTLARMGDASRALEMIQAPETGTAYRAQWYWALTETFVALGEAENARAALDAGVAFNKSRRVWWRLGFRGEGEEYPTRQDVSDLIAAAQLVEAFRTEGTCAGDFSNGSFGRAFMSVNAANLHARGQFGDLELALLACQVRSKQILPLDSLPQNWLIGILTPEFGAYDVGPIWRDPLSGDHLRQVLYPDGVSTVPFDPVGQPHGVTPDMLAWANAVWLGHHYAVLQAGMDPDEARALIADRLLGQSGLDAAASAWSADLAHAVSQDDRAALRYLFADRPPGMEDERFRLIAASVAVYAAQMGDMALLDAILDGALSRPRSARLSSCGEALDMGLVLIAARALADRGQIDAAVRTAGRVACGEQEPVALAELAIRANDPTLLQRAIAAAYAIDNPADRMRAFTNLADVLVTLGNAPGTDP